MSFIPQELRLVAWFIAIPTVCYGVACLCEKLFHIVERRPKKQ